MENGVGVRLLLMKGVKIGAMVQLIVMSIPNQSPGEAGRA